MIRRLALTAVVALGSMTTMSFAQQETDPNVNARKAYMGLLAYNIGVLGGMAQGRMDYDAAAASTAASNIHALSMVDTSRMWADGTDNQSMEGTRALPAIWENAADFDARIAAMASGAEAMVAAAGTDLASLQGAIGGLGGACGACHQSFRQPE